MGESRIDRALARIEAALARMDAAHENALTLAHEKTVNISEKEVAEKGASEKDGTGSARVMELVNAHEKLREEVADSLRDLDELIGELEG